MGRSLADENPGASRRDAAASWSGAEFLAEVRGPASEFPVARVLFLAHRVGASGAVRYAGLGGAVTIGLRKGKVVQVVGVPGLLAALGPSVADTRDAARDLAAAVAAGHAPDRALGAAAEALGAWVVEHGDAASAIVAYEADWTPPPGAFPLADAIPRVLARGLTRVRADAAVARAWSGLTDVAVEVHVPMDAPDTTWGLDAIATRALRHAAQARTVGRLLALLEPPRTGEGPAPGARRVEILRALEHLRVLGLLALAPATGSGAATPPPPRPGPASPDAALPKARIVPGTVPLAGAPTTIPPTEPGSDDPRAARFAAALADLEAAHPVDVLELGNRRKLTEEDVAGAYREISRRYHPDLYHGAPSAVKTLVEACFARVNAANEALSAPGGLAEAKRFLEARARGEVFVGEKEHVSARVSFRRAEHLFRAREYAAAAPLFEEALRTDPHTWPHAVSAAWCGWLARTIPGPEAVARLDAIKPAEASRLAEVLVYAGTILKQEGRANEALARFRAALAKDPNNRDAQREVRLHELRNPPKQPPPFSGLFKK